MTCYCDKGRVYSLLIKGIELIKMLVDKPNIASVQDEIYKDLVKTVS